MIALSAAILGSVMTVGCVVIIRRGGEPGGWGFMAVVCWLVVLAKAC